MIEVSHLSKSYGPVRALHDVNFTVGAGEVVGLLGPNGAGKTTLIKILTGYLHPDWGTVRINGLDVLEQPRAVQAQLGYLPETVPLYPELTVQEYLLLMAELRGIPTAQQAARIAEAVYATGLQQHLTRPIAHLSKGYRQRVGLAQAILHRPRFLILDEPTVGLDPTQVVEVRQLIRRLARHTSILFSTHILSEVEAVCDRVLILINGELRADARLAELAGSADVRITFAQRPANGAALLQQVAGVKAVEPFTDSDGSPGYLVRVTEGADVRAALFELARAQGWPLRELRRDVRSLESVFASLAQTTANGR